MAKPKLGTVELLVIRAWGRGIRLDIDSHDMNATELIAILNEARETGARHARELAERDAEIRRMHKLLAEADNRLRQYIGMCSCPGMPCVTSCAECDKTQGLANRIHAALSSAPPQATRCTCAAIQAADQKRHFKECPLRAEYPDAPPQAKPQEK